jgi:hypothetical protein
VKLPSWPGFLRLQSFQTVTPAADDRIVAGLVCKPKRRRVTAAAPNKHGLDGLNESAEPRVSAVIYAFVRTEFFIPDDHVCSVACACLKEDGFTFTDEEFEKWWEDKGHRLALQKAKSARHLTVDALKQAVWLAHGAPAACVRALFATCSATYVPTPQWARTCLPHCKCMAPTRRRGGELTTRRRRLALTPWRC